MTKPQAVLVFVLASTFAVKSEAQRNITTEVQNAGVHPFAVQQALKSDNFSKACAVTQELKSTRLFLKSPRVAVLANRINPKTIRDLDKISKDLAVISAYCQGRMTLAHARNAANRMISKVIEEKKS